MMDMISDDCFRWLCGIIFFSSFFLEDLDCLSRISLTSIVFIIRQQLVNRMPEHTILLIQGIFNIADHINMVSEQLAFDDAVRYTQWWKSKLAELMAWGI